MTLEKLLGLSRHSRESGNLGPQGLQQLPWTPAFRGGDEYAREFQSNGKSEEPQSMPWKERYTISNEKSLADDEIRWPQDAAAASASLSI